MIVVHGGSVDAVNFDVDGSTLYGEYHPPPRRGHANVVMLHGFNSCLREFRDAPRRLASHGFYVLAFDQRGYGRSGGPRGWTSLDRLLEDLEGAVEVLNGLAGHLPLVLVGHSLGGAYALAAGGRSDVEAVVSAHPVRRLMDELHPAQRLAYHAVGRWGRWLHRKGRPASIAYKAKYEELFVSEEAVAWAKRQHFLHDRIDLRSYDVAHSMDATHWASQVRVPALGIWSPHDQVVEPRNTLRVLDALAGPQERLQHEGGHSCFGDLDGPVLVDKCALWLHTRFGGP